MKSTVSLPVRLWRICRLVVHLFRGLVLVSGRYGRLNRAGRAHAARDWGHRLLSILGARVRVEGEPPEMICANSFFVANHVSWLDIFAIQSVSATRFVAKSEIRRWPVVGWLAAQGQTIFHQRGSQESLGGVLQAMMRRLRKPFSACGFTSGTTSRPKLVEHSQVSYPVGHLSTMYFIGVRPGDVHLNISSPGWGKHAWSSFFSPWLAGATVYS